MKERTRRLCFLLPHLSSPVPIDIVARLPEVEVVAKLRMRSGEKSRLGGGGSKEVIEMVMAYFYLVSSLRL